MRTSKKIVAAAVAAGAVALGGAGVAVAGSGSDDDGSDKPITGAALGSASDAALAQTGGGEVTETEVGDEEGAYEVEGDAAGWQPDRRPSERAFQPSRLPGRERVGGHRLGLTQSPERRSGPGHRRAAQPAAASRPAGISRRGSSPARGWRRLQRPPAAFPAQPPAWPSD